MARLTSRRPHVLRELGAEVIVAHNTPNGRNINRDCGSTHPEEITRIVKETGADIGISHDGDADRCLLCDENGEVSTATKSWRSPRST